jgi:3-oxoacyl-[acyl-carrier protein] reductase
MARTIVVTGAGTGIGKAIAAAFVADGDTVFITGRRAGVLTEAAAKLGPGVTAIVCDGTDPDQVAELRDRVGGPVDVLVNNAGGSDDFLAPQTDDLRVIAAHWRANLDGNLLLAVLTTAALEPVLVPGGAVVHIGSFATDRGQGAYGAAKAALASWNIHLAQRLGQRAITSNVVSPGYITDTEFFGGRRSPTRAPEFYQARVAETLVGRAGTPDDVAAVVRFLASPAARHMTAQVVHVNGGALTTR